MEPSRDFLRADMEKAFNNLFKAVDKEKWPLFIEVQKQLLSGSPVPIGDVAATLHTSIDDAKETVGRFGETDRNGKVVAFAGISIVPTPHSFNVNGKHLYTWCAADALIFPSFLDVSAEIESSDPISGEPIRLSVNRKRINLIQPRTAYVSWVDDIDMDDIRNTMCRRIHFFASLQTAEEWQRKNPNVTVLPVGELLAHSVNPMDCC